MLANVFLHTGYGFPQIATVQENYCISHALIRPVEKIKFDNFHVFDILWAYRTSRYAIVKVYVTERNDVTKRHGIVTTIWQTSAIEVTALSNKPTLRNERYERKRIYHGCEG